MSVKWNYIKFGDLFDYENKSKVKAGDGLESGSYPFYTSSVELTKFLDQFQFNKTSLIFGTGGNASIHYCENRFSVSTDCLVAFAKDETKVYPKYVFYYLSGNINLLEEGFKGAGLKHISKGYINEIQIPLPPLATQKRIAEILDAADALWRKDQELLKKYDELAQAIFIDMFGDIMENKHNYPLVRFGDVCDELFLGLTSKVDYVENGGYPLIRATDINQGELSFKNVKFISETQHRKLTARRITKKGDVLISKSGTLGTCAIVDSDEEFSTYESIFTVRAKPSSLNNIFLTALVRNPSFQEKLIGGKVGAGVAHLNLNMLRELIFPLPPIELQSKFKNSFNSISRQKKIEEETFSMSLDLFNVLIQKAFKGELVA